MNKKIINKKPMNKEKQIIEEFDKKFPNEETAYLNDKDENVVLFKDGTDVREIKSFILKALKSQREEIVENEKKHTAWSYNND